MKSVLLLVVCAALLAFSAPAMAERAEVGFGAPNRTGENLTIPVEALFDFNVIGLQIKVFYDGDKMAFLRPARAEWTSNMSFYLNDYEWGQQVAFLGTGDGFGEPLPPGEGALVYLRLKILNESFRVTDLGLDVIVLNENSTKVPVTYRPYEEAPQEPPQQEQPPSQPSNPPSDSGSSGGGGGGGGGFTPPPQRPPATTSGNITNNTGNAGAQVLSGGGQNFTVRIIGEEPANPPAEGGTPSDTGQPAGQEGSPITGAVASDENPAAALSYLDMAIVVLAVILVAVVLEFVRSTRKKKNKKGK